MVSKVSHRYDDRTGRSVISPRHAPLECPCGDDGPRVRKLLPRRLPWRNAPRVCMLLVLVVMVAGAGAPAAGAPAAATTTTVVRPSRCKVIEGAE